MTVSFSAYVKDSGQINNTIISEVEMMYLEEYGHLSGCKIYKPIKRKHSLNYNK